jgi:hypothetical protein
MATREALAALFVVCGLASVVLRQRVLSFFFVWAVAAIVPFAMYDHAIEFRYTYLPTLPFIAFVVVALDILIRRLPKPAKELGYGLAIGALVFALIVAPLRTRDAQAGIAFQAHHYELMLNSVRNLCGPLPPESRVWVVGSPVIDYFHLNTSTALSLYYNRVYAGAVAEVPGLAAFVEDKCVIQYDAATETYTRVG